MRINKLAVIPVIKYILMLLTILCIVRHCCLAETLTLPAGLVTIRDEAFMDSASITELVIQEGAVSIGAKAFANTGLTTITLPSP